MCASLDISTASWRQPTLTEVVSQLVDILRAVQPQAVITFGPDGISGHPDHLAIHRFTTTAFDQAGLPARLYYLAPSEATMQGCGVIPSEDIAGGPVAAIDVADYSGRQGARHAEPRQPEAALLWAARGGS